MKARYLTLYTDRELRIISLRIKKVLFDIALLFIGNQTCNIVSVYENLLNIRVVEESYDKIFLSLYL